MMGYLLQDNRILTPGDFLTETIIVFHFTVADFTNDKHLNLKLKQCSGRLTSNHANAFQNMLLVDVMTIPKFYLCITFCAFLFFRCLLKSIRFLFLNFSA